MNAIRKKVQIILIVSILINIFISVQLYNCKKTNNYLIYITFKKILMQYDYTLSNIDHALTNMPKEAEDKAEYLSSVLMDAYVNLSTSDIFMKKMYHLNNSFNFDIHNFRSYIGILSNQLEKDPDNVLLAKHIENLRKINELEKKVYGQKLDKYDKLIGVRDGNYNVIEPSQFLKNIFKEIDAISNEGIKIIP